MNNKDLKYCIGFSFIPGIGRVRLAQLENYFGTLEKAWEAPITELKKARLDDTVAQAVIVWRPRLDLDEEMGK
jgi:DNA processing protein